MSPFAPRWKGKTSKDFLLNGLWKRSNLKWTWNPRQLEIGDSICSSFFCRRYLIKICKYRYFPASIYVNISCLQHTGGVDCNIKVLFSPPTNWLIAQGHSIVVVRFWTSKSDALCVKKRDGNTDIWLQHFGILNQKFWFRKHLDAAKLSSHWFFMVGQ